MTAAGGALPAGTVTFVFTDIEGSTRLVRLLGDAYADVLERHRELLRTAWSRHGGHEIDTEGDSFFVAFPDQAAAITACAEAQRSLATEPWPDTAPVRVRMGVHTGLAVPRGNDYVAFAVHQAARIVNTGHGGQIVVSPDAARGVVLPPGLSLRSLGVYRVRDFDEPIELWQVCGDGLDDDLPALRVLPAEHHNLATPLTPIVGRERELAHLAQVTRAGHLVSIVGPGGVGKTRLAVEYGFRALDRSTDGVWYVDLSAVPEGELVASTVAAALGVRTPPDSDVVTELVARLSGRHALVILDNVEHVREDSARVAAAILAGCPTTAVLVTSREPLALRAEIVMRLGSLSWSGDADAPAVRLFLDRAADAGTVAELDRTTVAELCRRLDGLPLAIEMAAARTSALTPPQILAGLDGSGRGFVSRDPTIAERHRSLDDLLIWSDRLLDAHERLAVRRLAVFSGSFGYEIAAAAVADDPATPGGIDADAVAELVWSLANKSLLAVDAAAGGTRYRFPETVRAFARRHDTTDEATGAARRLATWLLARIGPTCAVDRAWVAQMSEELDNVRGLIAFLAAAEPETAQRLAWSVGQYHDLIHAYPHGIDELRRHVVLLDAPTPSRVSLLTLLAGVLLRVSDTAGAAAALAEAQGLRRRVGAAPWDDVGVERMEGELALMAGDAEDAARLAEEMLGRPLSDRGQGRMWNLLGVARHALGDQAGAAEATERELAVWERLGLEVLASIGHGNVAEALLTAGDRRGAARHQRECLTLALRHGQPLMVTFSWMVAARLAADEGRWDEAVRLQAAADERLRHSGVVLYRTDRDIVDALMTTAEARMGHDQFEAARARGRDDDADTSLVLADEILAAVANAAPPELEAEMRTETHA